MKPRLLLLPCCTAIVLAARAWAGLDLSWNSCNLAPGATSYLNFACASPESSRLLFGSFQLPADMTHFFAMDMFIDIKTGSSALPPFWHYEPDGCNNGALFIHDQRPPGNEICEDAWGSSSGTTIIAAYQPGFGGDPSRARIIISAFREQSIALTAGTNYYGFHLAFLMGNAPCCSGCETPAEIVWNAGIFYDSTAMPVKMQGPGLLGNCVAVNQPGCFVCAAGEPNCFARSAENSTDPVEQRTPMPSRSGIGCPTAAISRTWGMIKQLYR